MGSMRIDFATTMMTIYGKNYTYEILALDDDTYVSCVFPVVPTELYDVDSTLEYCTICNVLASIEQ